MRKFIALMLVAVMALTVFVACDKEEPKDTEITDATATKAPETDAATTAPNGTDDTADDTTDDESDATEAPVVKNEIKKATPVIDGVIDDAYVASAKHTLEAGKFFWNAGNVENPSLSANSYFLWDENYIYLATEVVDSKVVSRGEAYFEGMSAVMEDPEGKNPYQNDCVEHWFIYNSDIICKVAADAEGYCLYTMPQDAGGSGKQPGEIFDIANSTMKTAKTDNGYVIELALKMNGTLVAENAAGVEIKYGLQVNDISNPDAEDNDYAGLGLCCYGVQIPVEIFMLAEAAE